MAQSGTTFFMLPLELRQKIYLLATELKEVKARAKDPELNWLGNKEPATGASAFRSHLWRTYAVRGLDDHPSILLTELVCETDLVLRTLGALLLLEECRPDLVFVIKQTLEDVKRLKESYGANANRATCPLRLSSAKPVRVEFLMKLMTQLLKNVVRALEVETRGEKSDFQWQTLRDWKNIYELKEGELHEGSRFAEWRERLPVIEVSGCDGIPREGFKSPNRLAVVPDCNGCGIL